MTDSTIVSVASGGSHTICFNTSGQVFVWGCNYSGELGLETQVSKANRPTLLMEDPQVFSIACGKMHSMILKRNGELYVFGNSL